MFWHAILIWTLLTYIYIFLPPNPRASYHIQPAMTCMQGCPGATRFPSSFRAKVLPDAKVSTHEPQVACPTTCLSIARTSYPPATPIDVIPANDNAHTMNSFSAYSPLIRRQVPWTCNACLRRSTPQLQNGFATKTNASARQIGNAEKIRIRRRMVVLQRRLVVLSGVLVIAGAGLVTVNGDAKHAYVAVQRSSRVLSTLFLNVKE